jgi:hypothetical protein
VRSPLVVALGAALLAGLLARAQSELTPVLEDVIYVEVQDRDLVAFDLEGSGRLVERLEIGESVLSTAARGRIAVALTNRRVLGASPKSGSWQSERYRVTEDPSHEVDLSQGLAIVVTPQRALAFFPGRWTQESIGPREVVQLTRSGPGAGVVLTDRRALGVSSRSGGFFEAKLRVGEQVESVTAVSSLVTITTSERTLYFRGATARWAEYRRNLN